MHIQSSQNRYIYFYGGTNREMIKTLSTKVNSNSVSMEMEQYNMGEVDSDTMAKFWSNISSFYSKIKNNSDGPVLNNVQKLLSMKDQKAWLLLSKGPDVLVVDHYKLWM